jgi:enamine deaminase RidA (YjgF/YER057c/UK114 family)
LKDFEDFAEMKNNDTVAFKNHCPARSTVRIARLNCDSLDEIEAIVTPS